MNTVELPVIVRIIDPANESVKKRLEALYPNFDLLREIAGQPNSICICALRADILVGCVFLLIGAHDVMVEGLFVSPEFRRQKIAELIAKFIKNYLRPKNINSMSCLVRNNNLASLALLEKVGFLVDGARNQREPFSDRSWYWLSINSL